MFFELASTNTVLVFVEEEIESRVQPTDLSRPIMINEAIQILNFFARVTRKIVCANLVQGDTRFHRRVRGPQE